MPINYFADSVGSNEDEAIRLHLRSLTDFAAQYGFGSIFDAALAQARLFPTEAREFAESEGLGKLYDYCCNVGRKPITEVVRKDLCRMSQNVYLDEWRKLLDNKSFKIPIETYNQENILAFSFDDLYDKMEKDAPNIIALTNLLISSPRHKWQTEDTEEQKNLKLRKQKRRAVVAICVLANETSQQFNVLQNIIAYHLFASKVPKRTIAILNHLGISASYTSLLKAIGNSAKEILKKLRNVCSHGEAIWISFDNLTCAANVRDQRLINQSDYLTYTAGYVVRPHIDLARPMFTRADRLYDRVRQLNVIDFVPSAEQRRYLTEAFESMIYTTAKEYFGHHKIKLPKANFAMPNICPLDPQKRPEIITLPTYDLNEGVMSELIKILDEIQLDVGMTPEQVKRNLVLYKGDFMTVRQNRYSRNLHFVLTLKARSISTISLLSRETSPLYRGCDRIVSSASSSLGNDVPNTPWRQRR